MWYGRKEWSTKENKGEIQENHYADAGAAVVGKKARLGTKQH